MSALKVSIVIPVKDEVESVRALAEEVEDAFGKVPYGWECLWIDDGSTDGTTEALAEIAKSDHHRHIRHFRNFGQSAAFFTGFKRAKGEIIATLDGDLQNDPQDLPPMIEKLQPGIADMVNGVRQKRRDSFVRKASSKIANGFRNWVTGDKVTDVGCSVRVFYKRCVENIPLWKGMHRFMPTLVKAQGYKVIETQVSHRPRKFGETKYGIHNRLWVGLLDTFGVRWYLWRRVHPEVEE